MCFPITLDLCPSIYGQLFYLQDILINVIYAHILFLVPFPALIYLSPILSHMLFIFAFTFSPTMARLLQKKKISLVTYEVICLSLNNDCECKTPASWNMFALWRWSRLFSSCPHAFFFFISPEHQGIFLTQEYPLSFAPQMPFLLPHASRTGCSY